MPLRIASTAGRPTAGTICRHYGVYCVRLQWRKKDGEEEEEKEEKIGKGELVGKKEYKEDEREDRRKVEWGIKMEEERQKKGKSKEDK